MKLTRIQINEFFNLQKIDIDLSPGHALILGPNGTGKSKIFKCVQFLVEQSISSLEPVHLKHLLWNDCERIWNLNADSCYIKLDFTLSDKEMNFLRTSRIIRLIYHIDHMLHEQKIRMRRDTRELKRYKVGRCKHRQFENWAEDEEEFLRDDYFDSDDPFYPNGRAEDYEDTEGKEEFVSSPECEILNRLINNLESLCNEFHDVHKNIIKNTSLRLRCDVAGHDQERALVTKPEL